MKTQSSQFQLPLKRSAIERLDVNQFVFESIVLGIKTVLG